MLTNLIARNPVAARLLPLAILGAGVASAQTGVGNTSNQAVGAQAITSVHLTDMIEVGTGAAQQIVSDNGKLIIIGMMPFLGFYFLQARVRGMFG